MELLNELNVKKNDIEKIIYSYLPKQEGYQKTVFEAMNYSIEAGGKRLRPMLMQETYRLFGGTNEAILHPFMAAMEMIHTYSLVHDDLPAMDNDEYRRGRKTTHIVFGEAMGILAGDALLNYAFETATKAFEETSSLLKTAKAFTVLSKKAGVFGMIGGQVVDVESEGQPLTEEKLEFIHHLKTSALIEASMMIGAILAGADDAKVNDIEQVARHVGLAFQIQDDILDVTSTIEELGKPIHSDEKNNKTTYVTLFGLEQAGVKVEEYTNLSLSLLEKYTDKEDFLYQLLVYLITRKH
ncbi:MAG: polyprenyl synthetase family protein [bacterium]|nr:polyprenyl synthetase family protein [bacterium]